MNFSCSGNISKWTFVARSRTGGNHNQYPLFQLWKPSGTRRYERVYESSTSEEEFTMADKESRFTVGENIPDNPVTFEAGYIFGVYQPRSGNSRLSVRYARVPSRYGYVNHYRNSGTSLEVFEARNSNDYTYPLVAVNTGKYQQTLLYKVLIFIVHPSRRSFAGNYFAPSSFSSVYTGLS